MRIQHNIAGINSYRNLGVNQRNLSKNLEKLSSGFRINRAGDDAAGLAISESMRSQINGLNQAAKNADDAIGLIQTAEGALTETHSMLQRMKTLATQSANGTYTDEARANIQKEFNQLKTEIDRIADTTEFSGVKPLLVDNNMKFQIGTSNVTQNQLEITSVSMKAADLGKNVGGVASLNAVDLSSLDGSNKGMAVIEKAITEVSDYRATLGAAQNRLEHTVNNLNVTSENITAAESRIRDTDMADEMTAFTKNNILAQAAQSMLAQANAQPQGILSLLQ
jgi:flagellin